MSDNKVSPDAVPSKNNGRWALLIGINYYDRCGAGNLGGCVRDVTKMKLILQDKLNIPSSNITELLGRVPDGDVLSWNPPAAPTRNDILAAIERLAKNVPRGDFVYIHFSGHGSQVRTIYDKPNPKEDEALLCADGTIIRDVELGILLDDLSKGRVVLALLDCCHSGGALRGGRNGETNVKVRSWNAAVEPDPENSKWIGVEYFNKLVAKPAESKGSHWFYKSRPFNLIAACQPDEKACEFHDEENEVRGLLSSALVQSIEILGPSVSTTSYRTLMDILHVQCRGASGTNLQTPLMFGEARNVLFGLGGDAGDQLDGAVFSVAQGQGGGVYELNRGLSDGVRVGDGYRLTRPEGKVEPFHVKVVMRDDFTAQAAVEGRGPPQAYGHDVWFARRYSRAAPTLVSVICSANPNEAIDSLRDNWQKCVSKANPLEFHFGDGTINAEPEYCVRIRGGNYEVLFGNGDPLPNPIPQLQASAEIGTIRKLCSMLVHIQKFLEFDQLRPSTEWETRHEFELRDFDAQGSPDILRGLSLDFQNVSTESTEQVWITIMVLQPDWSVNLVTPRSGEPGLPVRGGQHIPRIKGKLKVPKELRENHGLECRDKFRMIISHQAHNFSHYELPSLYDFKLPVHRNFDRDMPNEWEICERIITWTVPER